MYDTETTLFDQKRFLYAFDEKMQFSKKGGPDEDPEKFLQKVMEKLDDTPQDYLKMKRINRNAIYEFLKELQGNQQKVVALGFKVQNVDKLDSNGETCDSTLNTCIISLLSITKFGKYLKEIITHLEYFYNTLSFDLRKVENPFKHPSKYPAF